MHLRARRLTYFGFLAQHTQRWSEVEDILGEPVGEATRARADALLHESDGEFKAAMRRLVAVDAPEAERWSLIRATQSRYLKAYFELTGMNERQLDDLLAGDLLRKYPPSQPPPARAEHSDDSADGPPSLTPDPRPVAPPSAVR